MEILMAVTETPDKKSWAYGCVAEVQMRDKQEEQGIAWIQCLYGKELDDWVNKDVFSLERTK